MKTKLQAVELVQRQMMLGSLLKAIRNENGGMQIDYALKLGYVKPNRLLRSVSARLQQNGRRYDQRH